MTVIADWLSVTFHPERNPADELKYLLCNLGFQFSSLSPTALQYSHPDYRGTLQVRLNDDFSLVSASGQILQCLRDLDAFKSYLCLLSENPHRVTRLDAAYDVHEDAADVLRRLQRKYPREVSLNRQRALRCHYMLSTRLDGRKSGTLYVGHRSRSRVTGRVYDKSLEALEKRSELLPDTSRYELTFNDGVASLWDALSPSGIFWAHAGALLPVPADAPLWEPSTIDVSWSYTRPEPLPSVQLSNLVSQSADLAQLLVLADGLGAEGVNSLMHLLAQRCGVEHKGHYFRKVINV